jgi:hypothetical protein
VLEHRSTLADENNDFRIMKILFYVSFRLFMKKEFVHVTGEY